SVGFLAGPSRLDRPHGVAAQLAGEVGGDALDLGDRGAALRGQRVECRRCRGAPRRGVDERYHPLICELLDLERNAPARQERAASRATTCGSSSVVAERAAAGCGSVGAGCAAAVPVTASTAIQTGPLRIHHPLSTSSTTATCARARLKTAPGAQVHPPAPRNM